MNIKMTSVALALIATSAAAWGADLSQPERSRADVRAELEKAYAEGQLGRQSEFVEFVGTTTVTPRAVVRAELERAVAARPHVDGTAEYVEHAPVASGKTRAEVRAEVEQAYADGTLGNTPEFVEYNRIASGKSRDEVREEAIRAAKAQRAQDLQSGS
ncbi:MAG TPA: DUF4148 domain-containing protein [Noviherbaspirillum sp.]